MCAHVRACAERPKKEPAKPDVPNVAKVEHKSQGEMCVRARSSSKYDLLEYFSGPGAAAATFYSIRIGIQLLGLSAAVRFKCECIIPSEITRNAHELPFRRI